MIITELRILNFRQYYGDQEIKFPKGEDKNVIVIHGENGEGKTAFLNLIKWCLYGEVDLPEPERLLNERAEAEMNNGDIQRVSVSVIFEDRDKKYSIIRTAKYEKTHDRVYCIDEGLLEVSFIEETGRCTKVNNPQNTVDMVLPKKMQSYFFFDGERIDKLSMKESSQDIKDAIKNIMGIELIESTICDLDKAAKNFRKEFANSVSNSSEEYIEMLEKLEKEKYSHEIEKKQYERNKKALESEKDLIYEKLRNLEGAKELQKQRDRLESEKSTKNKKIIETENELKNVYSSKGYLAFCDELISKVETTLESRRSKGEIPAGIKEQFVDDILNRKVCICGRELCEKTEEYRCVEEWKKKSANKELEDAFIQISGDLKVLNNEKKLLFNELERIKKFKSELVDERRRLQEELDEVSTKLDSKDSEDIKELEDKRKDIEEQISSFAYKVYKEKELIDDFSKQIIDIKKKINGIITEEEKSKLLKARYTISENATIALKEILTISVDNVREKLQKKINEVYDNFSRKGYKAILNTQYELNIIKEYDPLKRSVPMSQGERQITSLCFIGALVDVARERASKENGLFFKGGIYPIVMDSPFGQLDPDHKTRIAQGIPKLSQQVIIMVTDSQWNGEVENQMKIRVAKEYKLINHNPKKNENEEYEYTIIQEV